MIERAGIKLVDVTGIEPATPCLQRLVARRINNLHGQRRSATECYKCNIAEELSATPWVPVALPGPTAHAFRRSREFR